MTNNDVKIIVDNPGIRFINYLIYNNIKYKYMDRINDSFVLILDYSYYEKISKRYKVVIIKYYGKRFFINFFHTQKYLILSIIIGYLLLNLLCNTIFKITINTSDDKIYDIINSSLIDNDIKVYKKKKNFEEIELIKNKILNANEDYLEWIEIVEKGCTYDVNITPRVKNTDEIKSSSKSNIVASKDGKIMYITSTSGEKIKDKGDYVKKGDVIISGTILKNDNIVKETDAIGKVYAEVWYIVNVSVPYEYTEYIKTGEVINHYYITIFDKKFTIMGKYDSNLTMNNRTLILDKPYLLFKLYKEEKKVYEYKTFKIDQNKAYEEAIKRATLKVTKKLKSEEYIISKNVLKKEVFRSKMNVEVFFKVFENIGKKEFIGVSNGRSN